MGIAGHNLTVILASRYISIEFQSNLILRLIWEILVGDMNARTADKCNFIIGNDTDKIITLPNDYEPVRGCTELT